MSRSSTKFALLVLLALALAFKGLVLAMPPDEISPGGVPDSEEWRRGLAAVQWLKGSLLNPFDLQIGHFQGGTLLTVVFVTISIALFGDSPLSMRLANVPYDLCTVAFLFLIVDRVAGRKAAWVAGVLAAIPSTGYAMVAAQVWASHVEANAFAMALIWFWIRHVFDGRDGKPRAFMLGVLAGFSLYFHYGLALWLVVMLLVEAMRDRRAWIRPEMGVRFAGVLVGLLPWWIHNLRHDWQGVGLYGRSARGHFTSDLGAMGDSLVELFVTWLPGSQWLAEWGGVGGVVEYVFFGVAFVCWLVLSAGAVRALAREREVRPELILAIYPVLWTFTYVAGSFQGQPHRGVVGMRYMLPLHPIAWISVGVVLGRVSDARVRGGVVAAVAGILIASTATFLRPDHAKVNLTADVGLEQRMGRFVFLMAGDRPERTKEAARRALENYEPELADRFLFALGNCLLFSEIAKIRDEDKHPDRADYQRRLAQKHSRTLEVMRESVPARFRPYFESLRPKERAWRWEDREKFWRQWDARGEPRPEGAYAH